MSGIRAPSAASASRFRRFMRILRNCFLCRRCGEFSHSRRSGPCAKQTDRVFADLRGPEPGVPDGMKVDVEGNVYCGGAGGIWVLDQRGKHLGRIMHGAPATTNIAFGGADWKTLYFTSRNHLGAVKVQIPGIPVPVAKK